MIAAFYYAKQYDNVKMKIEEFIDKYPQLIRNIIPINVLALESDLGPSIEDAIKANYKLTELYAKVLQSEKMKNKQAERELISQMIKNYSDNPYMIALSFAGIGNKIKAMDWLEKSYYTKDKELVYVNVEPIFKELRTMDRFNNLIKKMNFPK